MTAEGERPSALASPLRVLPLCLVRRGSSRRSMFPPLLGERWAPGAPAFEDRHCVESIMLSERRWVELRDGEGGLG